MSAARTDRVLRRRCRPGCTSCRGCAERDLHRSAAGHGPHAGVVPSIVEEVLSSPGREFPAPDRRPFEQRLGRDFSGVRLHTDATAAGSARAVDSVAYTVGNDVVFDSGRYDPASPEGRRLLTHELAHVAQQSAAAAVGPAPMIRVSTPSDAAEREADQVADGARPARAEPVHLARNNRKGTKGATAGTDADLALVTAALQRLLAVLDEDTLASVAGYKTIAVGATADGYLVYTVNGNWTNANLEQAAKEVGLERLNPLPRAEGRGAVGAPGDAEQLMIEGADSTGTRVTAMAVTRAVCPDCQEAIKAEGRGRIKVAVVEVRKPRPKGGSGKGGGQGAPDPAPAGDKQPKGGPAKGGKIGLGKGLAKRLGKQLGGRARLRGGPSKGGGGRGGAGAAASAMVVDLATAHLLQKQLDPDNERAFDSDLAAIGPKVERLLESQREQLNQLTAAGRTAYVNVTLRIITQAVGGAAAYMGMDVQSVEVSSERIERIRYQPVPFSWAGAVREEVGGTSEQEIVLSLEYPSLEIASEAEAEPAGGGDGPCFVATACYGSPLAPEVELLRRFRDTVLLATPAGRTAVAAYYRCSPPVAALLVRHERLRIAVRRTLVAPAVWAVRRVGVR